MTLDASPFDTQTVVFFGSRQIVSVTALTSEILNLRVSGAVAYSCIPQHTLGIHHGCIAEVLGGFPWSSVCSHVSRGPAGYQQFSPSRLCPPEHLSVLVHEAGNESKYQFNAFVFLWCLFPTRLSLAASQEQSAAAS